MELEFVSTMIQGLVISIGFALFALIIATQNLFVALMACFTIAMIIVNVIAIIPLMGLQLGSSESIGVVVCVGFSVDYVVHLASHYVHSKFQDRHNRIREALRELGISILSGSFTTCLASAILFICVILTFRKFAMFVIATIFYSIVYSLGFFAAICDIFGPQNNFGNFGHMLTSVVEWKNFQ